MNQTGFGQARNGDRITVFRIRPNISERRKALWLLVRAQGPPGTGRNGPSPAC